MKRAKKCISLIAATALCLTGIPLSGISLEVQAAEVNVDSTVKLQPTNASTFNDTNEDGLGEFEGWGTSLCWWANRIGYSDALTSEAARLFFSDEGLDMNIGRYNVGGGDDVGEVTVEEIPANENAQFYGISDASYTGASMKETSLTSLASSAYAASDADFGFAKGEQVGNLTYIGWINELGTADDTSANGGNLHYTVNVDEEANYTVKLLLTLSGSNNRSVAIRVNGDSEQDRVVDASTINNNVIASSSNQKLFLVSISDVALQAGDNTIDIGGYGDWTLDFVKMAVIKSGEEGILPETDEFLHAEHIVRSDSGVPGYATDVTKIDTSKKSIAEYEAEFTRVDEECGYAWNYDWNADANQMNILKAAAAASGEDFIAEAFSNSPPYFMTVSGCSSGNTDSSVDNLRADSVNAFAAYMADVIEHWNNEGVITFQSATPMNEPYTNYWGANSNKQEGCHFDQGESQSRIIVALNKELKAKGIDIILSASDETSIDTAITSWNALSDEAKAAVGRIDTHTYSGSDRAGLKATAEAAGRNLWMSEVDGAYTGGTNSGEMSAALGLAQRMMTDVNGLQSSAWILWNAIDMHADSSEYGQSWVNKGSNNDYLSMEALEAAWKSKTSNGYWGLAAADHDKGEIVLTMKYYGYGQFSRYIRPGYTIIGTNKSGTTLAAYDPEGQKAVVVAMNTSDSDKTWKFDLSGFENMGTDITAIRTSGTMDDGEKWADVTASDNIAADTESNSFTATMKANSITTYIIEGVSGIKEVTEEEKPVVKQISVTADQVSGEKVWNNGTVNTPAKVVDGDYSTFFDGVNTDSGDPAYVIIDLGEEKEIAAVSYAPRSGFANRCVGATIYGSVDGENWTALYTIEDTPKEGTDTMVYYTEFNTGKIGSYRYIKYMRDSECNLSELKVYELEDPIVANLKAHYDMSVKDGKLTDVTGNGKDAVLHDITESSVASYGDESVLQFNADGYADIPEGLVGKNGEFTVQTTFSTQTQANHWLWCFGRTVASWPNVDNYIFVGPMSAQGGYTGTVLAAISAGGETRMARPTKDLGSGYTTVTIVSDGTKLSMYMDGELVSELTHGKNVLEAIPESGETGFIGRSLYNGDALLKANVSDMKIWNVALTAEQVTAVAPDAEAKTEMLLADIQKALLNGNASASEIETDIKLPSSIDGYDLTWTIPENDAIAQDGKVTAPAEDVNVDVTVAYGDQEATFALTVPGENIEKTLNAAYEALDIPNKDDVRGNITLPTKTESGVEITWAASHPEIVDVNAQAETIEGYGETPAGVVTRPAEDTAVTMTATLTYKGETRTKEIVLNVKAAPAEIDESDYTDYFFAYFAGEGYAGGEQIYFASSQDGMNWDDLNNNNPVLTSTLGEQGVRDPFIIRSPEGDKFYMIATDLKIYGGNGWDAAQNSGSQSLMVWESTDLVNWSEQRMVEVSAEIEAGCTWAPEATYDPVTGEYVVYWASRTPNVDTKQRLYYAKTRDFYTFTEPQLYIEKDQSSIDTTMIENDGTYYRYTKNEGGSTNELGALTKTIFIEKSSNVLGDFTQIASSSLNSSKNQYVEGPTIFKLNQDDAENDTWCLLVDDFGGAGYYPLLTTDLESGEFEAPAAGTYKMPSRARHGTPIRITAAEYDAIMAVYGTPETVNVATIAGQTPELPETVTVGKTELAVTWNLEGVSFDGDIYSSVTVTGTVAESGQKATANVQIIPENVEYMIDCNNTASQTWKNAASISSGLKNNEAADQAKTDGNTWGYVSTLGSADGYDMTAYSQNDVSNPYAGGYWARGGKNIAYQVTLPAGEHTIMLGCTGWWSMGRQMDVYYSVNGGDEVKLCDFDAVKSSEIYAEGTITLDESAVVTITVKKAANDDPILSWITVCGTPADEPAVIDYTELKTQIDAAEALSKDAYTTGSYAAVTDALTEAKKILNNAKTQDEADSAAAALAAAISGLVPVADFSALQAYYAENGAITGSYTEDSFNAYVEARNAAAEVLANRDASQTEVDQALANLQAAVAGLIELPTVNKDKLEALYAEYKAIDQGNYTDESFGALQDALAKAEAVLNDPAAAQDDVDQAYAALQGAYGNLKEKEEPTPAVVDKTKLQQLYSQYVGIAQGKYTDDSFKALQKALKAAEAVLNDEDATQNEVSAAYSALYDAVKGLTVGSAGSSSSGKTDSQKDKAKNAASRTGDTAPIVALVVIALAAVLVAVIAFRKRRQGNR